MNSSLVLDELLQQLSAGTLDDSGRVRLNECLRGDPLACERYLNHQMLEGQLHRQFGGSVPDIGIPELHLAPVVKSRVDHFSWALLTSAAAVILVAVGFGLMQFSQSPAAPTVNETSVASVAMIVATNNAIWNDGINRQPGLRLRPSEMSLESGHAWIRFDSGAEVIMHDNTILAVETAGSGKLRLGTLTFRVPEEAIGFSISTPVSEVIDLGTEFQVAVGKDGNTEVQVLDGSVRYEPLQNNQPSTDEMVLTTGQGIRIQSQTAPTPIPVSALRFATLIQQQTPSHKTGTLLAYEPFNYNREQIPNDQFAHGGLGWKSPWASRKQDYIQRHRLLHDTSIVTPVNMTPAKGRALQLSIDPEQQMGYLVAMYRLLKKPIFANKDDTRYISYLLKRGQTHVKASWIQIFLRSDYERKGNGRSVMGASLLSDNRIAAMNAGENNVSAQALFDPEKNHIVVIKIVTRAKGLDVVSVWLKPVDSPLPEQEPSTWSVVGRGAMLDEEFDQLTMISAPDSSFIVDEFRVGTSWDSVVPASEAP